MKNQEIIKLEENEIQKVQDLFYTKNGYENILNDNLLNEDLKKDEQFIRKYGEVCFLFSDYINELSLKYMNKEINTFNEWRIDFKTSQFIITF